MSTMISITGLLRKVEHVITEVAISSVLRGLQPSGIVT